MHLGDVRMIHHRQRLPLGLEASDDLARIHAGLDDLERHAALDRVLLVGDVNQAHAAFTDPFQQLVRADHRARAVSRPGRVPAGSRVRVHSHGRPFQKAAGLEMVGDQPLDPVLELRVAAAGSLDEGLPLRGRGDLDRLRQYGFDAWCGCVHGQQPVLRVSPRSYA